MGLSGRGFGPMGVVNWFDCSQESYTVSTPGCFMYLSTQVYLQSTACYNGDVTLALQMGREMMWVIIKHAH